MNAKDIMEISPIVPVIVVEDINDSLDLAKALYEGGIGLMEITLRTKEGLYAIELIKNKFPSMRVGAGTVRDIKEYQDALNAGAEFIFSPGISNNLIEESKKHQIPFIPGVSDSSNIMLARENDLKYCKLFPASLVGGVEILKAYQGPFNDISFCPTGGININNMNEYLALENVKCVGGSWLSSTKLIKEKRFDEISKIAKDSLDKIGYPYG